MKLIPLSQDKYAIVDDVEFLKLCGFRWHFHKKPNDPSGYARRWVPGERNPRRVIYMHQEVLATRSRVDHRNHDTLDNRRENLRRATAQEQTYNRRVSKANKSCGFKGVSQVQNKQGIPSYWIARITVKRQRIYLGVFETAEQAARAYDEQARKLHGEFACLNFP